MRHYVSLFKCICQCFLSLFCINIFLFLVTLFSYWIEHTATAVQNRKQSPMKKLLISDWSLGNPKTKVPAQYCSYETTQPLKAALLAYSAFLLAAPNTHSSNFHRITLVVILPYPCLLFHLLSSWNDTIHHASLWMSQR